MLIAEDLKRYFPIRGGMLNRKIAEVKAVDDVSFTVLQGRDARHRRRIRLRQVHPRAACSCA